MFSTTHRLTNHGVKTSLFADGLCELKIVKEDKINF